MAPTVTVKRSPIFRRASCMSPRGATASPGPPYQRPARSRKPRREESPRNVYAIAGSRRPGTATGWGILATTRSVCGSALKIRIASGSARARAAIHQHIGVSDALLVVDDLGEGAGNAQGDRDRDHTDEDGEHREDSPQRSCQRIAGAEHNRPGQAETRRQPAQPSAAAPARGARAGDDLAGL